MIPLHLIAHHAFLVPAGADVRPALKACSIDGRRMTRFTQLALLGAAPLQGEHLYLASPFHSPATFLRTFDNLLAHNLPSPLDFIANLHNAAAFHVAKYLGIGGTSIFMAVDSETVWQPLWLAVNEVLACPDARVLVGWVWEAPPESSAVQEGSIWWCLSGSATQNEALSLSVRHSLPRIIPETTGASPLHAPLAGQSILQMVAGVHEQLKANACAHLPVYDCADDFFIQLQRNI